MLLSDIKNITKGTVLENELMSKHTSYGIGGKVLAYIRPYDRYELIRNCRLVDEVIEDAPLEITKEYIEKHKIDLVVHGNDKNKQFSIQHKIPLELGIMRYVEYTSGISTSDIIREVSQ